MKPSQPHISSFRITKEGRLFLLLLAGVGFAAFNTGNNLLYLVCAFKVCLFGIQLWLCHKNIRGVAVRRTAPLRAIAGELFPVTLHVSNTNRRMPVFGIQVRDIIDGEPFKRSGHFLRADANETRHIEYRCELAQRGRHLLGAVMAATAFPFGLTERRRMIELPHQIIVWPRRLPVHFPRRFSPVSAGMTLPFQKGESDEFRALRKFEQGDDARKISWKATARQERLILKETEALEDQKLDLTISFSAGQSSEEREFLISVAASLADLVHQHRIAVGMWMPDGRAVHSTPDSCEPVLDELALLDVDSPLLAPDNSPAAGVLVIDLVSASLFAAAPEAAHSLGLDGGAQREQASARGGK